MGPSRGHGSRHRFGPVWILAGVLSCAGMAQAQISCNFAETFCGWSPNPAQIWQATAGTATSSTGSTVKPPAGVQGMAVANSAFDGFGELLSEEIFLPFQTTLTFRMMQQIFATTTVPNIQLNLVPSDGSAEFQIYNKRDQFTWSANIQVTLEPRTYSFRLKFRFKVGVARSFAGVAAIVLANEALIAPPTTTEATTPTTTTLAPSTHDRFVTCTFRAGMCAWQNAADSQGQWSVESVSSVGLGLPGAPDVSTDEHYILARGSDQALDKVTAILKSPYFEFSGPSQLTFWRRIKSEGAGSSTKLRFVAGSQSLEIDPNTQDTWEREQFSLNSDGATTFEFIAELESRDYIAIDEIVWNGDENGSPNTLQPTTATSTASTTSDPTTPTTISTTTEVPANPITCSFAQDLCGWSTETQDNFQWTRTNFVQASPRNITGVQGSDGYFLFAQGTLAASADRAHLLSTSMTLRSRAVLRFYIYATAAVGDSVYVQLNFADGQQQDVLREPLSSSTFNRWSQKSVVLDTLDREFSILIGAGAMTVRRFGLDEITFAPEGDVVYGNGPIVGSTTVRTTTERTTPTPIPVVPDALISCSFAVDNCGWRTHPQSEGAWERTQDAGVPNLPATASSQLADPWFVAFRGLSPTDASQGLLESRQFRNDRARNITFWYYKRGTSTGISYVGLRVANEAGEQGVNIWRHQGTVDADWAQATVSVRDTGVISLVFYCGANNFIICGIDEIEFADESELEIIPLPETTTSTGAVDSTTQILGEALPEATCDFEDGVCNGWLNVGDILWEYTTNATSLIDGAHNGVGYVYSTLSFGGQEYSARLRTQEINALTDELTYGKVTFWVNHANSVSHYRFSVHAISSLLEHDEIAFADPATDTHQWTQQEAYFCLNGPGHLLFRAEHSDVLSSIGLDDIVAVQYSEPVGNPICPQPADTPATTEASTRYPLVTPEPHGDCYAWEQLGSASCNFDNGICEYWGTLGFYMPFIFGDGPVDTVPDDQPSSGYAVTNCTTRPNNTELLSYLEGPEIAVEEGKTFHGRVTFWYYFNNIRGDNKYLQVYLMTNFITVVIWNVDQGQSGRWRFAEAHYEAHMPFKLSFVAEHVTCGTPVAIDTVSVEEGKETECESFLTCDFDHTLCGWTSDDLFLGWQIGTGTTGIDGYAIVAAENETYAYIDSNLWPLNTPAKLTSKSFVPYHGFMTLRFHAYGYGIASLSLFADTENGKFLLWETGPTSRGWQNATIEICIAESFVLSFEALFSAPGFLIGLDDVVLRTDQQLMNNMSCAVLPQHTTVAGVTTRSTGSTTSAAPPTSTPMTTVVTLPPNHEGNISCEFENDLCDWRSVPGSLHWEAVRGEPVTVAHNGGYAIAQIGASDDLAVARMISPTFNAFNFDENLEIEFYYQRSGRGSSGVQMYLVQGQDLSSTHMVYTTDAGDGQWSRARATFSIRECNGRLPCRLLIETYFLLPDSWSAIDSLVLHMENGVTLPTTPVAATTMDPAVSIIEQGTCSFDVGLCTGWATPGFYKWQESVANPIGVSPHAGNGFVYVENQGILSAEGRFAELETPAITADDASHNHTRSATLSFWYYQGMGTATFQVYSKSADEWWNDHPEENTVWKVTHTVSAQYQRQWRQVTVRLCFEDTRSLVFRVTPGSVFSNVGLDEVITTRNDAGPHTCETLQYADATCGFEAGTCGWHNEESVGLNWRRSRTVSFDPNYFMQTQVDNAWQVTGTARLVSDTIHQQVPNPTRLTFWYRTESVEHRATRLKIKVFDEEYEIWHAPRANSTGWTEMSVVICQDPGYQLIFESTADGVSIDNIELTGEISPAPTGFAPQCPSPILTCDFEDGLCGWRTDPVSPFRFHRAQNVNNTISSGQIANAAEGNWFIYAAANHRPSDSDAVAHLVAGGAVRLAREGKFSFWYHARGFGVDYVRLSKTKLGMNGIEYDVLWEARDGNTEEWQRVEIVLCDETEFYLEFSASFKMPDHVIALDAIELEDEGSISGTLPPDTFLCPGRNKTTISCNFNNDTCGWTNNGLGIDWTLQGDDNDRALTASAVNQPFDGAIARITSRPITSAMPRNTVFRFWSDISGQGVKYLRVILREPASDQVLWERNASREGWSQASFVVCTKEPGYSLVFETAFERGDHEVYIDDVELVGEEDVQFAQPGLCPLVSCNFEHDTCGWENQVDASASWTRSNALLEEFDHYEATPDGFWHMESIGSRTGHLTVARLISPCILIRGDTTMNFWHHSYGRGIEYLQLKAFHTSGEESVLWHHEGASGIWLRPEIDISLASSIRLVLEAGFTASGGVLGLDKVKLLNEATRLVLGNGCPAYPADRPLPQITTPSHTLSCSLDRNFCDWNHDENFTIASRFSGFGGSVGGFALARRSAVLSGPLIMQRQKTQMFFFYRAHEDLLVASLDVHYDDGRVQNLWRLNSRSISFGRWIPVRVPLCITGRFRLVFDIQLDGLGNHGFGLDEIIINSETTTITTGFSTFQCTPPASEVPTVTCDFGNANSTSASQCGWDSYPSNSVVQTGVIPGDEEHASPVLYVIPEEGAAFTHLVSPSAPVAEGTQFSFSYILRGGAVVVVEMRVDSQADSIPVALLTAQDEWTSISITLPPVADTQATMQFNISFPEASAERTKRELPERIFALDDVWYSSEEGFAPTEQIDVITEEGCEPISHTGVTCDFQCGALCGWEPPSRPMVGWKAVNGSYGIGPYAIPNDDGEGYLVADSHDVVTIRDPVQMRSKAFPELNSTIVFAYRTFGYGIQHLRLYAQTGENDKFILWETGDAYRDWVYTAVPVCINEPVVLVFEALFSARGFYVAVDHVIMNEDPETSAPTGTCPALDLHTSPHPITTAGTDEPDATTTEATVAPVILPEPIEGTVSCDFEEVSFSALCGWQNADGDQPQWTLRDRIGETNISHVFEAEPGNHFAGAVMGNGSIRATRLVSVNLATANLLNASSNHFHVEFFYRTSGRGVSGVAVYVATSGQMPATPIWATGSGAVDGWNRAIVDFDRPSSERIQLVIEARFMQRNAWIAVDRIVMAGENGNILPPTISSTVQETLEIVEAATCSFDVGLCPGWLAVRFEENFNRSYHGVGAQSGNGYVSAEHPEGFSELYTRPLLIADGDDDTTVSVTFWFLLGPGTQLELQIHEPALGTSFVGAVWEVENNAGDVENPLMWHYVDQKVCVPRNETTMLVFHVNHRVDGSFAAIDEVLSFKSDEYCEPLVPRPQSDNVTCDFEDFDTCGWESTNGWRPVRGPHGPPGYGITDVNEGYMLTSSNVLPNLNNASTLQTRRSVHREGGIRSALTFTYRAYGHGIHSLELYAVRADERFLLWEAHDFNPLWVTALVPICFNDPIKLVFEARFISRGFYVGLDHVILLGEGTDATIPTEECPTLIPHTTLPYLTSSTASPPTTTEPPVTLPGAFDGEISCSFENNNLCAWRNVDSLLWNTSSALDNTTAHSGAYFAVASPRGQTGYQASIVSPNINQSLLHGHQLTFQFYYRVSDRGSMGVSLYTVTSDIDPTTEYAHFGPAPFGQWNLAFATLRIDTNAPRRQLKLTSKFVQRNSYVAIDDIVLHAETGDTVPTRPPTPTTPPVVNVIESGTCSFDVGLCAHWESQHWKESISEPQGPTEPQSGRGYVFVYEVKGRSARDNSTISAELRTPPFNRGFGAQESTSSKMTFWTKSGPGRFAFEVVLREQAAGYLNDEVVVYSANGTLQDAWTKVTITFCAERQQFVVFRVELGDDFTYLALDEVLTVKDNIDHCPVVCTEWKHALSCDFNDGRLCDGWTTGMDTPYMIHQNGSQSAGSFAVANVSSSPLPIFDGMGAGHLVSLCSSNESLYIFQTPDVTFVEDRTEARISAWYYSASSSNYLMFIVLDVGPMSNGSTIYFSVPLIPGQWNRIHDSAVIPAGVYSLVGIVNQWRCEDNLFALDEIVIETSVSTECIDITCTFDDGHTCDWENTTEVGYWKLGSGHVGSGQYGINGSAQGAGFLYLDSNDLPALNYPAGIQSAILPSQTADFFFYYRAFGTGIASVTLYAVHDDGGRYPLWHTNNANRQWMQGYVRLCLNEPFRLVFEGVFSARDFVIGLDDFHLSEVGPAVDCTELTTPHPGVSITTFVPTSPTTPAPIVPIALPPAWDGPAHCTFEEENLCSWRNLQIGDNSANWTATSIVGYGITSLSEAHEGFYFAAATPETNRTVARLMSPNLGNCSQPTRIQFYTRSSGSNGVSGFTAYLATNDMVPTTVIWSTPIANVWAWQRAVIEIPTTSNASRCQLILEAHFMRYRTWVAIDDIISDAEPGTTARPTSTEGPTGIPLGEVHELTCSFDEGMCQGWQSLGLLHWQAITASHLEFNPAGLAPQSGHGFAYVEQTIQNQDDRYAELETPFYSVNTYLNETVSVEITFWYLIGGGTATLDLFTKKQDEAWHDPAADNTIWTATHTISSEALQKHWRKATVTHCFDHSEALVFRLTPRAGEVVRYRAALDEVVTVMTHTALDSHCPAQQTNHDITCDFNGGSSVNGLCGWTIESRNGITWSAVGNASNGFLETTSTNTTTDPSNPGVARLISSHVNQFTPNPTKLTFRYRRPTGVSTSYVKLNIKNDNEEFEVWRERGDTQLQGWTTAEVYLCFEPGYRLLFETNTLETEIDDIILAGEVTPVQPGDISGTCRSPLLSCSFEDGFCGWHETRFHRYRTLDGVQPANSTSNSWFVAADSSDNSSDATPDVAQLAAYAPIKLQAATKFTFWYFIKGNNSKQLTLTKGHNGWDGAYSQTLFANPAGTTDSWQSAEVILCDESAFTLFFTAVFSGPRSFIGLDEFIVENEDTLSGHLPNDTYTCPGSRNTTITCDFDTDNCGWMNAMYYQNVFEVVNGSVGTPPSSIAGAANGTGYLASHSSSSISGARNIARIMSRPITSVMPQNTKFSFWYNMAGYQIRHFQVILKTDNVDQVIWERADGSSPEWKQASVTVCGKRGSQLIFQVQFTMPDSVVAIDSVLYAGESDTSLAQPGSCPVVSCNFENGVCGWIGDVREAPYNARWVRSSRRIDYYPNPDSGKDGRFHIEAAGRPNQPSIARLYTPCLSLSRGTIVEFHAHLSGSSIQYLQLKAVANDNETVLWSSSQASSTWINPRVSVSAASSVVLILEAGFSGAGAVVAVDQIRLHNEAEIVTVGENCTVVVPPTQPTTRPTRPTITTPVPPRPNGTVSCSFDTDFCGYGYQGFSISDQTSDITSLVGDGMAWFKPTSSHRTASLTSRAFYLKEKIQIFFFYFAHQDIDAFTITAHYLSGGAFHSDDVLFELRGSAGAGGLAFGRWIPGRVTLCVPGFSPELQLVFTVTAGLGSTSEFAIDEVMINREAQALIDTPPTTPVECPVVNRPNSITCEDAAPGGSFCGWEVTGNQAANFSVQTIPGTQETALVVQLTGPGEPVEVVSQGIAPHNESSSFSFRYILFGAGISAQVFIGKPGTLTNGYPLAPSDSATHWSTGVVEVPASQDTSSIVFRISSPDIQNRQITVTNMFALGDTWYSNEYGFIAGLDQPETTTTSTTTASTTSTATSTTTTVTETTTTVTGPTTTVTGSGNSTVSPPTDGSTTTQTTTTKATSRDPPRPTLAPVGYTTQEIVIISVGSVSGALILLAIVIGFLHWRSKRNQRRTRKYPEMRTTETPATEMTTRASTMSHPPAYTSKPGTPPSGGASGPATREASAPGSFKTKGFDEDVSETL